MFDLFFKKLKISLVRFQLLKEIWAIWEEKEKENINV